MPNKNTIKVYVENGNYHVYNRGVNKRKIFKNGQDYKVFLSYLKEYLSEPPDRTKLKQPFTLQGSTFKGVPRQIKNYHGQIELHAFCLMPNHFHFLIKQNKVRVLKNFMQSLCTRYSIYFNKKYRRIGPLFQGIYKACLVENDNYLLHLSRYIHLNPAEYFKNLDRAYSSYADYLGLRNTHWIKKDFVLTFFNRRIAPEFKKINNYKDFVEKYKQEDKLVLGGLILES